MNPTSVKLSVLVLAGGQGARLGGRKPSARMGGRTLLERALAIGRQISEDVLLLPRDRDLAGVPGFVRVVADHDDVAGPLAGLAAGLAAARHAWCLALPCDMPFAHAGVVEVLSRRAASSRANAIVVRDDNGLQPFHGLYHRRIAADLVAYLASGRRSMRGLLESTTTESVDAESLRDLDHDLRFLDDIDTPTDLAVARARLAS